MFFRRVVSSSVGFGRRLKVRGLIFLAIVVILLALVGWITFGKDDGRASINLETETIREDTGEMMKSGSELLDDARDEVEPDAAGTSDDVPPPPPGR